MFVWPLSTSTLVDELRIHISQRVTLDMLKKVWYKLSYRLDNVQVSEEAHIEHLWMTVLNLNFQMLFFISGEQQGFTFFLLYFNISQRLRYSFNRLYFNDVGLFQKYGNRYYVIDVQQKIVPAKYDVQRVYTNLWAIVGESEFREFGMWHWFFTSIIILDIIWCA